MKFEPADSKSIHVCSSKMGGKLSFSCVESDLKVGEFAITIVKLLFKNNMSISEQNKS